MAKRCFKVNQFSAISNAKDELLKVEAIDENNNILNEGIVDAQIERFNTHTNEKYGFKADMLTKLNGKVLLNMDAYQAIDLINGRITEDTGVSNMTANYVNEARYNQAEYFDPVFNANFFNSNNQPDTSAPTEGLTKIVTLKTALLDRAKRKLVETNRNLRENKANLVEYNKYFKLKNELTGHIESLENEIEELARIDTRAPEIIAPYILNELARLDRLTQSIDPADISEARTIIDFVKSLANFDLRNLTTGQHPLYHASELYDKDGTFLLGDTITAPFRQWAATADDYAIKLAGQNMKFIENVFNNNDKIKAMFTGKEFGYGEIVSLTSGMKDASWIDSMLMDISAGITSQNGLLPQVIRNTVDNKFEEHYAWAKELEEKIDNLTPKVVEELKKMGYGLSSLGIIGVNGVHYDLFKQIIPNTDNQSSGDIVHKYSYKWFEDLGEMNQKFDKRIEEARAFTDSALRKQLFEAAILDRNKWYANNTVLVDPSMVSSIVNDQEFASLSSNFTASEEEITAHEAQMKALVGEDHFNKLIDNQKIKLRQYIAQRQGNLEEILADEGVNTESELTERGKRKMDVWDVEHNPFLASIYRRTGNPFFIGSYAYHPKFTYNNYAPAGNKNYYDDNFKIIEVNPILKEFYDTLYESTSGMRERFSFDVQNKVSANSIPFLEQNILEILTDKNLTFYQAISKVFRNIIDKIKSMFAINKQDQFSYAKVNPNTGVPDYQVNDNFITQNLGKIQTKFKINRAEFAAIARLAKLNRFSSFDISKLSNEAIEELTTKYMGRSRSRAELKAELGDSIPVGKIIYRNAQHEIAKEKSFDLPKVIKLYSHLAAQYSAREELLPIVEMMKLEYQKIKAQSTNNLSQSILNFTGFNKDNGEREGVNRTEGVRVNANKQIENWFERVVLGNFGLRKHYGVLDKKHLTNEEKNTKAEAEAAIKAITGEPDEQGNYRKLTEEETATVKEMKKIIDNLGSNYAGSATVDAILNFLRFRGLGFNVSSGINNFIEGQIANSITASTGNYFNPEHIYTISPSEMVAGDLIKQTSPQNVPENVAKAEFLSKASDVLQDNSNELQKASAKTAFSSLQRLNPYYQIAKTEQYNQIPLMVATLKSEPITAIDGKVGNVWDALKGEYLPDSKQWTVKLKPEFATPDNIKSWENYEGESYKNWKSKAKTVISNTHGDFSNTGGMMAKSFQAGQIMLMFKTWMPREFYKRFAVEQDDIATGLKGFKGRWRSHTPVTAAMQGGVMGSYLMGPLWGTAIGAAAGYGLGVMFGSRSSLTVAQELSLNSKLLLRKLIGMPVNLIGSAIGKNHLINTQLNDSHFADMQGKNFTKQDFNNLRGNMQELSIMMAFFGMLLLTKAIAWDDDDKSDDPRRMAHNFFANRFMQLASSGMMYANLTDMGKTMVPPLIKFATDVGKTISAFSQALGGEDTLMSGINAGESRSLNQMKKTFLPGIFQNPKSAGLAPQMERQFVPSEYDSYFFGEEKDAQRDIKKLKAERKLELIEAGELTEEEVKKQLSQEFPRRKKGQKYTELLEQIEDSEDGDD